MKYQIIAVIHLFAIWHAAWLDAPLLIVAAFVMGQLWLMAGMVLKDVKREDNGG